MALNQYKIDVSPYFDTRRPYALFSGQRAWWGGMKWDYITSFPTVEEATVAYRLLTDLPIQLTTTSHSVNTLTVDRAE